MSFTMGLNIDNTLLFKGGKRMLRYPTAKRWKHWTVKILTDIKPASIHFRLGTDRGNRVIRQRLRWITNVLYWVYFALIRYYRIAFSLFNLFPKGPFPYQLIWCWCFSLIFQIVECIFSVITRLLDNFIEC